MMHHMCGVDSTKVLRIEEVPENDPIWKQFKGPIHRLRNHHDEIYKMTMEIKIGNVYIDVISERMC